MRAFAFLAAAAVLAASPMFGQAREGTLRFSVEAQLVAADAEAAGRALSSWADAVGGFFVLRSQERVVLRLPAGRITELRPALEKVSEEIVGYAPSAADLREEMAAVEAAIVGRQESLRLILTYLEDADVAGTLALEREIQSLVQSLEQLEGRRRLLRHDAAYARVEVLLRSPTHAIPTRLPSSFSWINTVDLYLFLERVHDR